MKSLTSSTFALLGAFALILSGSALDSATNWVQTSLCCMLISVVCIFLSALINNPKKTLRYILRVFAIIVVRCYDGINYALSDVKEAYQSSKVNR